MTIIWGTNFSLIKTVTRELDPQAFNALRMAVASLAFLRGDGRGPAVAGAASERHAIGE